MRFPQELIRNVVFLTIYDSDNDRYVPIGTAFFLGVRNGDDWFPYLVTCKHVVKHWIDTDRQIYIRANRSDKHDVGNEPLNMQWAPDGKWTPHDDDAVDLVVYPWMNVKPKPYQLVILPEDDILLRNHHLSEMQDRIAEGDDIVFVGLFAQYSGNKRNFPVVRWGKLALITDEKIEGEYGFTHQLLIEAQVYPGNSGAPLYIAIRYNGQNRLFIIGMVASFYPNKQYFYSHQGTIEVYTHYGISAAVPAVRIGEILYREEFVTQREEELKRRRSENKPKPASNATVIPDSGNVLTRDDFMEALRKVSHPDQPKHQPGEEKSETSE